MGTTRRRRDISVASGRSAPARPPKRCASRNASHRVRAPSGTPVKRRGSRAESRLTVRRSKTEPS
ncbi:hypothetical protein MBEHAL_1623 [Halarchaeum acidiphilum MH1-52-1]|uniref:Uncharacterized protein n=1 Tax=Halarchaeum acidiphilum MH1-52-1 TaxID=1261545 RepID=U3ADL9_9EURY|nr:hypothetical protein MBEHAL_1623 [Halarchaeum acidiphilum MH1-52-1]